jgi:hypothetical protein
MRPIRKTVSSIASSDPIPLDHYISPSNVTVDVLVNGVSVTYAAQYTTDDIYANGYAPASGNWSSIAGVGGAASATGNIAFPVTAVRLDVSAIASGDVTLTVIQSGGPV